MLRVLLSTLVAAAMVCAFAGGADEPAATLQYARGAARWILSLSKNQDGALTWPVNDGDMKQSGFDLYSGMPGGILLLAELAKEDPSGPFGKAVAASVAGLESLQVSAGGSKVWGIRAGNTVSIPAGLYTGASGVAWLYLELHRLTGEQSYLDKARAVVATLLVRDQFFEGATLWDNSADIVSGAAGIGLLLLRAADALKDPRCLDLARKGGTFLLSQAISTPSGIKWKVITGSPTSYPNFAHGTAGIAYFLLRLYKATGDRRFLNAAGRGALELQATAEIASNGKSCTWYHHEGDGEDLWYVGWCHGPAGTARLFYELRRAGQDNRWQVWIDRSANWLLLSGIPDPPKPINGYWNESVCCGTAGVGEFMADLYLASRKKEYLQAAGKMAAHLAKVADSAGSGYRWIQAENRLSPLKKDAQTGYAQGAAGVGLFFLKLSRAQRGMPAGWRLPDNPF